MGRRLECSSISPYGLRKLVRPSLFILIQYLLKDRVEGLNTSATQFVGL